MHGAPDLLLLLRIMAVAGISPLLKRFPLPTLGRVLEPRRPPAHAPSETRERHVVALVDLGFKLLSPIIQPDCLVRGLTRYYVLRRCGLDVALAFGIGQPGADVAGHCWLVRNGHPYLENHDPRHAFVETARIVRGALQPGVPC